MPRRTLLSPVQRADLLAFPALSRQELVWHYTLGEADSVRIGLRRRDENRLGYALQLLAARHLGRTLEANEQPPDDIVAFVATQLRITPQVLSRYALRDETRREHIAEIIREQGLERFNRQVARDITKPVLTVALQTPRGLPVVQALIGELRKSGVLLPPITVLERVAAAVLTKATYQVQERLTAYLNQSGRAKLDALLFPEAHQRVSKLVWLRQPNGRSSTKAFGSVVDKLNFARSFDLPADLSRVVHRNWVRQLAREGAQLSAGHLQDLEPRRRHATLVATLLEQLETLTDEALMLFDRLLQSLVRRSENKHLLRQVEQGQSAGDVLLRYVRVGNVLIRARAQNEDPYALLEQLMPWEAFVASVAQTEKLAKPERFNSLGLLKGLSTTVRAIAPRLYETFAFRAARTPKARALVAAVALLRGLKAKGKRSLLGDAPTTFVRAGWESYVFPKGVGGSIDPIYYELSVLFGLREGLRSGDIFVVGSRQYRDFDDYLLPQPAWNTLKENPLPLAVQGDFEGYWQSRMVLLDAELSTVNTLLGQNALPDVRLEHDQLVVTPLKTDVPEAAKVLSRFLYARLPKVKITDLLLEVNQWTGYAGGFTHLRSGLPAVATARLLSVLLADGINLGLAKMAAATPGASYRELSWVADWFVRADTYSAATAELVNFQSQLPLAASWGDGTSSSSDGQHFHSGSRAQAWSTLNARYGSGPGATYYTHLSDQFSPFYTQVIHSDKRDALFVIDGLLYHETDLSIEEHYTDTAGFTEHVFALCHLFGFRFAPRIRDLGEKRLYVPQSSSYPHLSPLIGKPLERKLIEAHWDDLLRLATSLKRGTVTATLMVSKLRAYPRQNGLALALRELGRLERTLFTLRWLQSPELRRRVTVGLNKGEARNALADAAHFNRKGEAREKTLLTQLHKASGLNLLIAAIGVWNTVYLQRALAQLAAEGIEIDPALLAHVSPLAWEHIGLTGDYIWRTNELPKQGEYRKLDD